MIDQGLRRFLKHTLAALAFVLPLHAIAQPVILAEPQDQAVPLGGVTSMFVQVQGSGTVGYQWFFNSTNNPIASATNAVLVLSNATATQDGTYQVRVTRAAEVAWSRSARLTIFNVSLAAFGTITLRPAFELNGAGLNVDSIAFWEAPDPTNTLMFVTAKDNDLLEVWKYPFQGNERSPLPFPANVNGVAVDQDTDLLYVTDRIVSVFSLPGLQSQGTFGQGIIGVGENNLDILKQTNGQTIICVSEDHRIHRFDAATTNHLGSFAPTVSSIETLVADDFYQVLLVPEEQGPLGTPGVFAYHPDGTPYLKNGTNRFAATGIFDSDEEGIILYTFPSTGLDDNGAGFIVVTDQRFDVTDFEFFDRRTWAHLGTLRLEGVSNTDGIASTQRPLPAYPLGLFAAVNDDTTTVGLGWDAIFQAVGFDPPARVLRITPAKTSVASGQSLVFTIDFNEPVTHFDDSADLRVTHIGTAHTGVVVTGSGTRYQVELTGISGGGYFVVGLNLESDIRNLQGQPLVSTVFSVPVVVQLPYESWSTQHGLLPGVNDDYGADPDNDGAPNLEEFATDREPLNANDLVKEALAAHISGPSTKLTYTFPVRSGAVFTGTPGLSASADGVAYSLSGALDLASFSLPLVEITPPLDAELPAPNPGWSYRTFALEQPPPTQPAGFILRRIRAAAD